MFYRFAAILVGLVFFTLGSVQGATIKILHSGLSHPWSLAFLPDGGFLITEKSGALVRLDSTGEIRTDIANVPNVYFASQGGLLDIALHPNFEANGLVYLSYAHGTPAANSTRVARGELVGDRLEAVEVLFSVAPTKDTPVHYGGRLLFLPDMTFLVTTGDGFNYREQAQDLTSLLGKVVRLNDDGSIPIDNPFMGTDGVRPEIFTYGHRNPQGLSFDTKTSEIVLHEHGPRGGDEINILVPGANYGWPAVTFGIDYSGAVISPFTEAPGMTQPRLHWTPSIAPSGLTVIRNSNWPDEWQGDYLVGALAKRHLRRVDMFNGRIIKQVELLKGLATRLRDVRLHNDDSVYILTDGENGQLISIKYDELR